VGGDPDVSRLLERRLSRHCLYLVASNYQR
jgi:hypothetical protein